MISVLHLLYKIPWPCLDGGAYSIYHNALALHSTGIDHKILCMNPLRQSLPAAEVPAWMREEAGFEAIDIDNSITFKGAIENLFNKDSYLTSRYYSEAFAKRLKEILREKRWHVIILEHALFGHYLEIIRETLPEARVVLRPQNIENELWLSVAAAERQPFKRAYLRYCARKLNRFETELFRSVDGIMAISDDDKMEIQSRAASTFCHIVPPSFDFSRVPDSAPGTPNDQLYHLGSMDWIPNQQGMRWFFDRIFPQVLDRDPLAVFWLGGRNMTDEFLWMNNDHIRVENTLSDALEYQSDKGILVVPLISGGGVRIKIMEALALGKAVVSTSKGCSGLGLVPDRHLLVADTPEAMANAIVSLRQDPSLRAYLSQHGHEFARQHFAYARNGAKILEFLGLVLTRANVPKRGVKIGMRKFEN